MTDFYLPKFICPWIATQKARLFGLGDEAVQCLLRADGWVLQMKNALSEEFCITDSAIQRGADTSSLWTPDGLFHGFYYIQYTRAADGKLTYGCNWSPLTMRIGDSYVRNAHIVEYWWDGRVKAAYDATTTLKFVAFHSLYTFPQSGITVADVIELSWGGEEVYLYAANYGLVGWLNVKTGAGSWLGSVTDVHIQQPIPHPIPRPVVPKPPEAYPVTEPPVPFVPFPTAATHTPNLVKILSFPVGVTYRNIRVQPNATATDIGDLKVGDVVTAYVPSTDDGWVGIVRASDNVKGWVLWTGVSVERIEVTPPVVKGRYLSPEAQARIRAHSKAITQFTEGVDDANAAIMAELDTAPEVAAPSGGTF